MSWLDTAVMYARFSTALRAHLAHRMTFAQAREIVCQRLGCRSETFLRIVQRGIYSHPASPYLKLLQHAGCEFGDLQNLVKANGVEGALRLLREQDVYIAFEEFKGRVPVRRNGLGFPVAPSDFDNPFLVKHFYSESSGSTGARTRVPHDLDQYAALAPNHLIGRAALNVLDAPYVIWRGILPDSSALNAVLYSAYYGGMPTAWFAQLSAFQAGSPKYTFATYYFWALARLWGAPMPFPHYVSADNAIVIARQLANDVKHSGACLFSASVSRGLRVALAAAEEGIDLTGVVFMLGSEPMTPDKARGITRSGAACYSLYALTEAGRVANPCASPLDVTDVHLHKDAFAAIAYARPVEGFEISVPAFHLTTLLPSAPKLMLNVEMDDYGVIEERECSCLWNQVGMKTHLRRIRSYRKLTGEGVTLIAGDLLRILENDLPARFGGTPLDYQLLEQEDARGLTRVYLLIHPRLEIPDEQAVLACVMQALRAKGAASDAARALWSDGDVLRIKRRAPIISPNGKQHPLVVQRHLLT